MVGKKTHFGLLLAEAVKTGIHVNPGDTVSLYETDDNEYIIIEWGEDALNTEYEASRMYLDNRDEAIRKWTKMAFSIDLPEKGIWDEPDTPDIEPKSPTWGPWGQDGRSGN